MRKTALVSVIVCTDGEHCGHDCDYLDDSEPRTESQYNDECKLFINSKGNPTRLRFEKCTQKSLRCDRCMNVGWR